MAGLAFLVSAIALAGSGAFPLVMSRLAQRDEGCSLSLRRVPQAFQCPDLPPSFSSNWMPSMRMPRSTALHMS